MLSSPLTSLAASGAARCLQQRPHDATANGQRYTVTRFRRQTRFTMAAADSSGSDSADGNELQTNDNDEQQQDVESAQWDTQIPVLNTVLLTGRLGADPVARYFDSGNCVAQVSLAVRREVQPLERLALGIAQGEEPTDWFPLEFWNQLAENVVKATNKGMRIGIQGSEYMVKFCMFVHHILVATTGA